MAHLLIIELPGGNDTDIIKAAISRGDEFTFISAELDHYHRQPQVNSALLLAREKIEVPFFDYCEVEERVLDVHSRYRIDAVICLIDIRITEAARLAHKLGLPFLNPASAALLRDKYSVRRRLAELNIAQVPFELATSNEELKGAVEKLGLPVLIKPADGYGSQNIVVLRYAEDLDPLLSPLDNLLPMRADYGLGVRANDRMLVERYMSGTVVGCDILSVNGRHTLLGINEKLMYEPPSFAIRGGCFTPNRPEFETIEKYAFSLLDAVGFDWGATHIELMLTTEGPRLIEINPRLVGAKIARLVGYGLGCSIHEKVIGLHAGESPSCPAPDSSMIAVSRWILASAPGILENIELPVWQDPRICCVELLKRPGDHVRPPLENADRIGYVMACATNRSGAEELADRYVSECRCNLIAEKTPETEFS